MFIMESEKKFFVAVAGLAIETGKTKHFFSWWFFFGRVKWIQLATRNASLVLWPRFVELKYGLFLAGGRKS